MAYYIRRKQVAYDNIAVGSATGKERTILGNAGSSETVLEYPADPTIANPTSPTSHPSTDIWEKYGNVGGTTDDATGSSAYIAEKPAI